MQSRKFRFDRALRARGEGALRHGLRGRPSNRKTPEAVERRAVELDRQKSQTKLWLDYGPTLAAEELAEQHRITISRETLRHWLIEAKLWRPRRSRVEQAHVWRARRARYGELVQWDTSEHHWLEGRGEKLYLIGMIDDATSRLTARFVRFEGVAIAQLTGELDSRRKQSFIQSSCVSGQNWTFIQEGSSRRLPTKVDTGRPVQPAMES